MAQATSTIEQHPGEVERATTPAAALAALGIVYGDLGTSPLYTLQTIISAAGGHLEAGEAIGILSLVFWALVIIVSVKYCIFVMRADNHGEGGILALMSLIGGVRGHRSHLLIAMGLFGAALIYGDGIITPAISVLSALEGVNVATDAFEAVHHAYRGGDPGLPVLGADFWDCQDRPRVRPDHAGVVRGDRCAGCSGG